MRKIATVLLILSSVVLGTAQAEEPQHGPIPELPPNVLCSHDRCGWNSNDQIIDGYKLSHVGHGGPWSTPWATNISYMPSGVTLRIRACVGPEPYETERCGPAAEVTTPQPPRPATPTEIIRSVFGSIAHQALKVADCESGMNPGARSPGGGNNGLFQINTVHRNSFARVTGQPYWNGVFDAYHNTLFAKWLYDNQGWGPWTCKKAL